MAKKSESERKRDDLAEAMIQDLNRVGPKRPKKLTSDDRLDFIAQRDFSQEFAKRLGYSGAEAGVPEMPDEDDD